MAKRRTTTAESPTMQPDYHVTPDGPVTTQKNDVELAFSDAGLTTGDQVAQPQNGNGERQPERRFSPLGQFHTITTPDNKVHLGKNDRFRTRNGSTGGFIIYFDNNPNEGRAKDDPHPVVKHMHESGYKYERAPDGQNAWIKPYDQSRGYSMRQQMDADDVARNAANLLGANIEVGQGQNR